MYLPQDAGTNASSYAEAHYMYAFAGAGVPKRGKNTVPFFTARGAALAWWEERMLHTPTDAADAAAAARFRGEIERDRAEIARDAGGGSEAGEGVVIAVRGLRLWREPTTTTTSKQSSEKPVHEAIAAATTFAATALVLL